MSSSLGNALPPSLQPPPVVCDEPSTLASNIVLFETPLVKPAQGQGLHKGRNGGTGTPLVVCGHCYHLRNNPSAAKPEGVTSRSSICGGENEDEP